jgi:hypothetical protein
MNRNDDLTQVPAHLRGSEEPEREAGDEQAKARTLILAREAWRRLNKHYTFQDWIQVGEALLIGRDEVLAKGGFKSANGRKYSDAFSKWLDENSLRWADEVKTKEMDKNDRANLLKLMERKEEVLAWHEGLTATERFRTNHPQVIYRKWSKTQVPQTSAPRQRRQTQAAATIALQGEIDALKRALHEQGAKIVSSDEPSHVANVLLNTQSESKVERIIEELSKGLGKEKAEFDGSKKAPQQEEEEMRRERFDEEGEVLTPSARKVVDYFKAAKERGEDPRKISKLKVIADLKASSGLVQVGRAFFLGMEHVDQDKLAERMEAGLQVKDKEKVEKVIKAREKKLEREFAQKVREAARAEVERAKADYELLADKMAENLDAVKAAVEERGRKADMIFNSHKGYITREQFGKLMMAVRAESLTWLKNLPIDEQGMRKIDQQGREKIESFFQSAHEATMQLQDLKVILLGNQVSEDSKKFMPSSIPTAQEWLKRKREMAAARAKAKKSKG